MMLVFISLSSKFHLLEAIAFQVDILECAYRITKQPNMGAKGVEEEDTAISINRR